MPSAVVALGAGGIYALSDEAARFADQLPPTAKKFRQILREQFSRKPSALANVPLAAGTLVIATVIGTGLNTWLSSRYTRMNPVIVFAGLLFFGWLWGAWGLLLGLPVLAVIKAISERVEGIYPIAELMRAD